MTTTPRRPLRVAGALAATCGLGCFVVEPLPECPRQDGLHVAFHVCMPPARAPIDLSQTPRDIAVGDFDDDGLDDLAVLSDPDHVVVYTRLDAEVPETRSLRFGSEGVAVGGFLASHFLDLGRHGDDLIAWIDRPLPLVGQLSVLRNGGDGFAAAPILAELRGPAQDFEQRPCYAPSNALALDARAPGGASPVGLGLVVVACLPNLALGATSAEGYFADDHPDLFAVPGDSFPERSFLALVAARYESVGPVEAASLEPGAGPHLVFAHRPDRSEDAALAVVSTDNLDLERVIPIEPGEGSIDQLRSADLDGDRDIDILAFHRERAGFSVIRQQTAQGGPLAFGEPEFYTLDLKLSAVALGDFTGDGGLDIAVAHSIDNSSLDGITIFALDLEQPGGPRPYNSRLGLTVQGAIVALKTLDLDGDGHEDLAAAVRDGTRGSLRFYVNRLPREP